MDCHLFKLLSKKRAKHRASVHPEKSTSGTKQKKTSCRRECNVRASVLPSASVSDTKSDDAAVDNLIHHLDEVGQALELTFKELDFIEAYAYRLCDDYKRHRIDLRRYVLCTCTAKSARESYYRTQLQQWQELSQGMLKLYCSIHQSAHELQSGGSCNTPGVVVSNPDQDISAFLRQLNRMSTLQTVIQRVDPGKDAKAFVEKWILKQSEDCTG